MSISISNEEKNQKLKQEGWEALKELENEISEVEMWLCIQKSESDAKRFKALEVLNKLGKLREKMKGEPTRR